MPFDITLSRYLSKNMSVVRLVACLFHLHFKCSCLKQHCFYPCVWLESALEACFSHCYHDIRCLLHTLLHSILVSCLFDLHVRLLKSIPTSNNHRGERRRRVLNTGQTFDHILFGTFNCPNVLQINHFLWGVHHIKRNFTSINKCV